MCKKTEIKPLDKELPSEYADRLGICYSMQVSQKHKKENGQFFTPIPIANLMASMSNANKSNLKILDPGCGTGILTCSLIENLIESNSKVKSIELVVYETDQDLVPLTNNVLSYLKIWLKFHGILMSYSLLELDFVLENAEVLESNSLSKKITYDVIISNPPYFKLSKNDERSIVAKKLVSGQPNIYSFFMGIASKLLEDDGELIFITPRSFASGNYFRSFRELFFNTVQIDKIHLFNSRKDIFNRDSVLQETVVIKAVKAEINSEKAVIVSSSMSASDIGNSLIRILNSSDLVDIHSREKILYLPTNDVEENVLNLVKAWDNNLANYDISISTGPVVAYRSKDFILENNTDEFTDLVPLFWLNNVTKMNLEFPIKLKDKGQYIKVVTCSQSILLQNKDYIFLRRFSTKDDNSRLIAAPYFSADNEFDFIGVENKVNYIYRKKGDLERNEVIGLCGLLNSKLFDIYFQTFNGNVNVSATELREMKFPPLDVILEIGNRLILSNNFSQENVNRIVCDTIGLNTILN